MLNILIVDDHEVVRSGLTQVLLDWRPDTNVTTAADAAECQSCLEREITFDLILLDLKLPDTQRFDLLDYVRVTVPHVPVVVFSGDDRLSIVETALAHGAKGYILKSSAQEVVRQGLETVLAGDIFKPSIEMSLHDSDVFQRYRQLTPRQQDILLLIAQGKTNKQIADELRMSPATVRSYLTIVFRTLSVKNRTEAVREARNLGLIE